MALAQAVYPGIVTEDGEGPLKVIRGQISSSGSGTIVGGTGFTIARNGTGDVTITFDTAFSAQPSVTTTRTGSAGTARTAGLAAGSVQVLLFSTAFAASDGSFSFFAIGPA